MLILALGVTLIVYLFYLSRKLEYIQSFPTEVRAYIKRRRVWNGMGWLCVVTLAVMLLATGSAADETLGEDDSAATALGVALGVGIVLTVILPPTIAWLLLCVLMSWRNSVGLKNEVRHLELLKSNE